MLLKSGFLETLKNANVTPVYKKVSGNDEASYRSVSILSSPSKYTLMIFFQNTIAVLEKILFHALVF